MEGDTVSVFWAVCDTNMLKKIAQDKDSQCFCSQDMQKCLRLMENYLPIDILVNIFLHTLQLFHHYMYYYLYILSLVFVLSVVHAQDIRRVKQACSFKTVISSPPRHLLLLFQLWLRLLALSTVFVNNISYTTATSWFLRWRYGLLVSTVENVVSPFFHIPTSAYFLVSHFPRIVQVSFWSAQDLIFTLLDVILIKASHRWASLVPHFSFPVQLPVFSKSAVWFC